MSRPNDIRTGELTLPSDMAELGSLAGAMLESSCWWFGEGRTGGLSSLTTTEAHIQGFELAHPQVYIICELWECCPKAAGSVNTDLTQGNNRITKKSPSEDPNGSVRS